LYDAGPMRLAPSKAAIAMAIGLAAAPAAAWTGPTRIRMIDDAVKLMPPALRDVLASRREALLRGMIEPMAQEDAPAHRPPWDGGTLDRSVDGARGELVDAVERHRSFFDVARDFGALAHFVADAGFPPGAAGRDGEARYAHFAAFCESRRKRFPLVFYGHDDPNLARGDFAGFARAILERERAADLDLRRAYAAAPSWDDPSSFDDRSVPFAIASLAYSHTVTDIVQAWIAAWKQCHGDLGGTPYMPPNPAKAPKRGTAR
jgi:hypothetical protein